MALSRVELELGNLSEARRWAQLARDSQASDDPERTKVAGCLAMVEYHAGRYDEARALLDDGRRRHPRAPWVLRLPGDALPVAARS